jgi:hypothetical protein
VHRQKIKIAGANSTALAPKVTEIGPQIAR